MLSADNFCTDISSNNPSFNAAQYRSSGHRLIIIKATESTGFVNPDYASWVHSAHQHGLAVIHYHFARPENGEPRQQADHFAHTIKDHFVRPGDFTMVDVETGSPVECRAWLNEYDSHLQGYGYRTWLYAPLSYYEEGTLSVHSNSYYIAAWGRNRPSLRRGNDLKLWQYTDGAVTGPNGYPTSFAGVPGRVDADVLSPDLVKYLRKLRK